MTDKNDSYHIDQIHMLQEDISKKRTVYKDGYLQIITGCMFAGKSSYIIRECKKWRCIGKNVLMLNYSKDTRYSSDDKIITHDHDSIDCMMIDAFIPDLTKIIEPYDVILINEAQFLSNLKKTVRHWVDVLKKIVIVSGLDGDYLREPFGELLDLIPDADDHIKLKAYCTECADGTEAIFTWKVKDRTDLTNIVDIGVDKYVPLCRRHYNEAHLKL
jgi:thymidine kinase